MATVISRAEALYQAKNYSGSGEWLDESGNGHHAQFGSGAGADTNDPQHLPFTASKYLLKTVAAGNNVSTPDVNLMDADTAHVQQSRGLWTGPNNGTVDATPTADVDASFGDNSLGMSPADGATSYYNRTPISTASPAVSPSTQYSTVVRTKLNQSGYDLFVTIYWLDASGGYINQTNGSTTVSVADTFQNIAATGTSPATAAHAAVGIRITGGAAYSGLRLFIDVGCLRAGADSTFMPSLDIQGTSGETVSPAGLAASYAAGVLTVGEGWAGDAVSYVLRDDTAGPIVATFDIEDATEPFATFTGSQDGRTWTINRSGSGMYVVDQDAFGLHTDDYFQIPDAAGLDFAAADPFTVMAMIRSSTIAAGTAVIVGKKDDLTTSAGWSLYRNAAAGTVLIGDGTLDDTDAASSLVARTRATVAGVRNVTDDDLEAFLDGTGSGTPTTDSTTATLANALPLRIGATSGTAASFIDGEIMAVAVWSEALSDADIATAKNELAGIISGGRFGNKYVTGGQLLRTGG